VHSPIPRAEFKKATPLQWIEVRNIFDSQTLTLTFSNAYTVFVADNGSGKTIALNVLQSILRKDFASLIRHRFSELAIKFVDYDAVTLPYSALVPKTMDAWTRHLIGSVSRSRSDPESLLRLYDLALSGSYEEVRKNPEFNRLIHRVGMPSSLLYRRLREMPPAELLSALNWDASGKKDSSSLGKLVH
jgi:hypothetical protein